MIFIMPNGILDYSTQQADRRNEIRIIFHTFNHTCAQFLLLSRKYQILITKAVPCTLWWWMKRAREPNQPFYKIWILNLIITLFFSLFRVIVTAPTTRGKVHAVTQPSKGKQKCLKNVYYNSSFWSQLCCSCQHTEKYLKMPKRIEKSFSFVALQVGKQQQYSKKSCPSWFSLMRLVLFVLYIPFPLWC